MAGSILRFITAGSVDDGKSTLIGRLLVDTQSVRSDQLEAVRSFNTRRGRNGLDLALFTDGLKAEREQGITIDVAYRYFSTPARKFIMADAPGHVHFTRNMVTGASTADLAVVLVDVRNGLQEQTRRHSYLASLLGIPEIILCVNKMDLVGYGEDAFRKVTQDYSQFVAGLGFAKMHFIPISALNGDNVVERSVNMPWYEGATLLRRLEQAEGSPEPREARFPVQYIITSHESGDGHQTVLAGRVAGGSFSSGDEVLLLPAGKTTRIHRIAAGDQTLSTALFSQSVSIMLENGEGVRRGDLLVMPDAVPQMGSKLDIVLCWLSDHPVHCGTNLLLQHVTGEYAAVLTDLRDRVDLSTLLSEPCDILHTNDIAGATLELARPMAYDSYRQNRIMGSVILIDGKTFETIGAGIIR